MIDGNLMTPKERLIVRHALGLDWDSAGYRNYFLTTEESRDYSRCESLVAKGLMQKKDGSEHPTGYLIYKVTDAGRAAVAG